MEEQHVPLSVCQLSGLLGPLSVWQLLALPWPECDVAVPPWPLSVLQLSRLLGQKCHVFA